jgi:hypothetical protein
MFTFQGDHRDKNMIIIEIFYITLMRINIIVLRNIL